MIKSKDNRISNGVRVRKRSERGDRSFGENSNKCESGSVDNSAGFTPTKKRSRCENSSSCSEKKVLNSVSSDKPLESSDKAKKPAEAKSLDQYGISEATVSALRASGIKALFPIQEQCYEHVINGRDLIGRARTGTGKTLAFSLPIIETLKKDTTEVEYTRRATRYPRALVMVPTRELAMQVNKVFENMCGKLKSLCVYGGTPYMTQIRPLEQGVDIVVGTPGRLIDLIEKRSLVLFRIRFVCLDEADQMLDVGFADDIDKILKFVKDARKSNSSEDNPTPIYQTLLFSATLPGWVNKIVGKYMRQDMVVVDLVDKDIQRTSKLIKHYAVSARWKKRSSVIYDVSVTYGEGDEIPRTIVFVEKKSDTNIVVMDEKLGLHGVQAIHGDIPQRQREATVQGFRDGKFKYLVATNVCARGIDIPMVDLVVNCEPPNDVESYIHRSGRTGRADRPGVCVTLFSTFQEYQLKNIASKAGVNFTYVPPPQARDVFRRVLEPSIKAMTSKINKETCTLFIEPAKKILSSFSDPVTAIASILAVHFNVNSKILPRSILNDQEGVYTVLFKTDEEARSIGYVKSIMQRIFPDLSLVDDISNIIMGQDNRSVVVDIKHEKVRVETDVDGNETLFITNVPCTGVRGVSISIAKELPRLNSRPDMRTNFKVSNSQNFRNRGYGDSSQGNRWRNSRRDRN